MPIGESRGPRERDLSGAPEALRDLDSSIYNMKSIVDTTNWDNISQRLHEEIFSTIDDFRIKMVQALESESWDDKEFPAKIIERLDRKIEEIKAR